MVVRARASSDERESMSFEAAVHAQAIELCQMSLRMCDQAGSGHPTSAMSLSHITTVLMFNTMRWSPEHPGYPSSDRLVLSEGHAVPVVYAAFAKLGGRFGKAGELRQLTFDDLDTLRDLHSCLEGHPNPQEGFPFFDAATGSLGQGVSVAVGLAEAARLDGFDKRIYCLIGDGEAREGQVGEALDAIVERSLNTILPIFNCNGFGQAGAVGSQQSPEKLAARLEALGFEVASIDGHNPAQILDAFERFKSLGEGDAPMAVVARTVKGWGAPNALAGNWHGKPASGDVLEQALAELDTRRIELTSSLVQGDHFEIQPPTECPASTPGSFEIAGFSQAMRANDMESVLHAGRFATRRAFGVALRELGKVNDRVVSLDADVSNSTFAEMFARDSQLASRFFECKIAEQHMVSQAVGLSAAGKIPFCSSFAKFLSRGYDQLEMAILSGANIKMVGSHTGLGPAADGPSQMGLSDIAWTRSFTTVRNRDGNPAMYVLQPADAYAAYALTSVMAEYEGACYLRTHRPDVEFLYSDDVVFNLGGFEVLSEGRDVLLVAAGTMVHEANRAIELLDNEGISASLVDLYSLPFDADALLDVANANGGYVMTLEDNYGASIGSAIADVMLESGDGFTLKQLYVNQLPKSARDPRELLERCGLDAAQITRSCMEMLEVGVA
ncbi:MAG: transketolase [Phycisphaerales bacterium JB043]